MEQSTSTIQKSPNQCRANRGRWIDPYTGKTFHDAIDLDIDHVVPLKWAWDHGANQWSSEKRKQFANDNANLLAVQASVNSEKGAQGVLDWLPPDATYHCQYIARWKRLLLKYKFTLSEKEQKALDSLYKSKCQRS